MVCNREKNLRRTCFCWTDEMNIEVVGFVSQETMINGRGDKEKVLLLVLGWRSRQLSKEVNETCCSGKVVRLDHLGVIQS